MHCSPSSYLTGNITECDVVVLIQVDSGSTQRQFCSLWAYAKSLGYFVFYIGLVVMLQLA